MLFIYLIYILPLQKEFLQIPLIILFEVCVNLSKMEGGKNSDQVFEDSWFQYVKNEEGCESSSPTSSSSIGEDSDASNGSSITSSDTVDDASSSSSSCREALYDLSEIMDQLPIKRGLSQFYQGKSESFTSLSRVTSIEDLMKKAASPSYRRNLKASKSCGTGLHSYKQYTLPKATISKKASRGVPLSSFSTKRGSFISTKPPLHQHLEC